ncbi:MAG: hypothetical protein E6Q67_12940 [Roseateles sp.]|nr:MAG: hypothetical protein E6Q67_12940 [Roseateles sp.]
MPTDTSVKFLHSAMTGAPILTGQAGSLIALLDACLVNGFGSGTVDSIVISNGVATVMRNNGHPFEEGSVALIAGATVTGGSINGEQKVLATPAPTSTTYCFDATGLPNQSATGSITHKVAPLGWNKVFAGTNLAVYKPSDVAATGCLMRVDDSSTTTARMVGYEAMSDISTGSGAFPPNSAVSGGLYIPKSQTSDSAQRPWIVFGDGRAMSFCHAASTTAAAPQFACSNFFGDPVSLRSPDPYGCTIFGSPTSGWSFGNPANELNYCESSSASGALFAARSYAGIGSYINQRRSFAQIGAPTVGYSGNFGVTYPNPVDGGLYLTPLMVLDSSFNALRGAIPGVYQVPQSVGGQTFQSLAYLRGLVGYPGKVFRVINIGASGLFFVDITGPWR